MSATYPFNTPLPPTEFYCRPDNTICVKNWAGVLVVEYASAAHGRTLRLLQRLSALYNQTQIPYIYTDYDSSGNFLGQGLNIYIRLLAQSGAIVSDSGSFPALTSGTAVRQVIFHTLPYRRDIKEIIDTV